MSAGVRPHQAMEGEHRSIEIGSGRTGGGGSALTTVALRMRAPTAR
jgi:hypothetical protein